MGQMIDKIKQQIQLSPQEFFAGFVFHFVVNNPTHFHKTSYREQPLYIEFTKDNDLYKLDLLYLMQEKSFPLSTFMRAQPDYKSVLQATPQILQWLESVYITDAPAEPVRTQKPKRTRRQPRPPMRGPLGGNALNQNALNTNNGGKRRAPR